MLGPSWQIRLFGGLFAERVGHPLVRFQTRKTGGLLAYLAYHLPDVISRDLLIEQYWPELDIDGGRNSLSVALTSLRRQLEPPDVPPGSVIVSTRLGVRLNGDTVRTDVQEFRALADEPQDDPVLTGTAAISLYRGYLLPACYDDWTTPERDRLEAAFVRLVSASVQALEERGDYDLALEHALAAAGAAPDHEPSHQDVIRLYRLLGRNLEALRQYKTLEERMREEWGRAPSAATRGLLDGLGVDRHALRRVREKIRRDKVCTMAPAAPRQETPPRPIAAATPAGCDLPSLPRPITRFFGREEEIAQLTRSFSQGGNERADDSDRLVTITGAAGAGKTRLALEAARSLANTFEGRTAYVPIGAITDPNLVFDALLTAIGVRQTPGETLPEQLFNVLANQRFLLVLDNAEHLGLGCAQSVAVLLETLPELSLLITSRVPLGIAGERLFPLAPLPTPSQPGTPERLLEFACVRMFVDRAQAVSPDFQITPRNASAIAAVCEKLEGMPLAIELAAARVSALTPAQMLVELERRFKFLVSKQRTVEDRHRTLEAALEWSFDLLPASTQRFFSRLSLFSGGWTLEGGRAVWQDVDDEEEALDHLERLVQQALIATDDLPGGKRFRMLESVREFAGLRLSQEDRDVASEQRTKFLIALAEEEAHNLRGPDSASAVATLQPEMANFRSVLTARSEDVDCLRLSAALWRLWSISGQAEEGSQWLQRSLDAHPDADETLRMSGLIGLGSLLFYVRRNEEAAQYAREALELSRRLEEIAARAEALNLLAVIADECGNTEEARRMLEDSLNLRRRLGDNWSVAAALNNLGRVLQRDGDLAGARRCYEESQDLFKILKDWSMVPIVLSNLGVTSDEMGDFTGARAAYEQSLMLCRELGNRRDVGILLYNLGEAMFRESNHPEAQRYLCESIQVRMELGDRAGVALPLATLGSIAAQHCDLVRAVRLYGAVDAIQRAHGVAASPHNRHTYEADLSYVSQELSKCDFDAAWRFGSSLTLDQAAAYAADYPLVPQDPQVRHTSVSASLRA